MAKYDSGVTFDSGIRYDDMVPPQPTRRMAKAKVKLDLKSKSDPELLTYAKGHVTATTGNANFTTILPDVTDFSPVLTAYETALGNFTAAQLTAKQATTDKDTARAALESMLTQRGNYVELTAAKAVDPVSVIESAGFAVKSGKSAIQIPEPVKNLSITAGDNAGELDLQWDATNYVSTYDVQLSPDPMTATSWVSYPSVTKSKTVIPGLTSGAKMWARVRGVGPGGTGAWSDVATKIVP